MAFERANAFAASWSASSSVAWRVAQLPHLDSLIETAADKLAAAGRERYAVHAVSVADLAFQSLDQEATCGIPHPHALVQGACCYHSVVRRDRYGRHAIIDRHAEDLFVSINVPKTHCSIAGA